MHSDHFVKLSALENPASSIPGWSVIAGNPQMKSYFQFRSSDGSVICGVWTSSVGTYRAVYADPAMHEFVHLIEGKLVITPKDGKPVTLGPGEAFVVEPGFEGTWEVIEPVRKRFVLTGGR